MSATVLFATDRPAFEDAWRAAAVSAGLTPRLVAPQALAQSATPDCAVVIDAASGFYDEDELLSSVGLLRALGIEAAVSLRGASAFAGIEPLLEDLCGGLLVRDGDDVARAASALARRTDRARGKRFEYLTVSPRPSELLAVLGDGSAALLPRPVSPRDDGSEVTDISLEADATRARLRLRSGGELAIDAAALPLGNGAVAKPSAAPETPITIDGTRLGARLRELRLAAGLTQAELARRTGIHRPNIARVEAGRHTPSLETLARLASAIGVSTTSVLAAR